MFPQTYTPPPGFPPEGRIVAPGAECHFLHQARVELPDTLGPLEAWNRVMAHPLPGMALAFRLRDWISARFGVKRIGGFSGAQAQRAEAGQRLDFFLIEEATPDRLVLSERDRHLDVLTCITATPAATGTEVTILSSVVTHNAFGRAYMLAVGPAHRLIVWAMLGRLRRSVAKVRSDGPLTRGPDRPI